MGFFEKIASLISGGKTEEKTVEKAETVEKEAKVTPKENNISTQDTLLKDITGVLQRNYKGGKFAFEDRILNVWIADNILYESLRASDFRNQLILYLDSQIGLRFPELELRQGPLPENHNFTKAGEFNVYLELAAKACPIRMRKAEIFAIPNYGSLKKEKYVLDSVAIEALPAKRYNIGAGEYPEVSGRFRCNQIAIDDDPASTGYERNKHVSRTHAYIRYTPENGFMLHAEIEGTILAGMRTRILRNEEMIEVDNVVPQPLRNGDCIELSKNVRLMFNVLS
jgi:hypothetical protein